METKPTFLTGQTLIALPGMGDARFAGAVIVICLHDQEGAMGVDIGRLHQDLTFNDVMQGLVKPDSDQQMHETPLPLLDKQPDLLIGGPVEPQRGFVIHSLDYDAGDTVKVADRFALTTSRQVLEAMAKGEGPKNAALALGYAGWGAGQLDDEMTRHGWLALDVPLLDLLDFPPDKRWEGALKLAGIDPSLLTGQFGSA